MLRVLRPDETPPDGWRYVHPETGYTSRAMDPWTWMEDIKKHRDGNNLPPVAYEDAANQMCLSMPPGVCEHYGSEVNGHKAVSTRLTWSDIATGIKAYVALVFTGEKPVEREEADRRANICSSCYLRVDVQGCGSCIRMADALLGQEWAARKTSYDNYIAKKACAACRCPLQSVVHFPMALLDKADSPDKQECYPTFCWRKQGGENRIE